MSQFGGRFARKRSSAGSIPAISCFALVLVLLILATSPSFAAAAPTLSILSPGNDEIIGNDTPVIVTFAVSGFALVQPGRVGQVVSSTEGHVDLYLDGNYSRLITRVEPISLFLPSGPHTIRMQLVRDDGTALSPDVNASVRITTTTGPADGTPTISITWPKEGTTTGHDVYFAINVTNFTLVDPHGQPNAPGEGHLQLFLNGVLNQEPRAYDLGFIVDMPDGKNTVTARLVNNDNTPLDPDVSVNVTFYIAGAPDPTGSEQVTGGVTVILAAILIVLLIRRRRAVAHLLKEPSAKP